MEDMLIIDSCATIDAWLDLMDDQELYHMYEHMQRKMVARGPTLQRLASEFQTAIVEARTATKQ